MSRKPPSIAQRLAYSLIKARAGSSAVLAARHHGSFMPFARTQTTVATGYASAVTAAPRSVQRATTGANPIGRRARLATGGGDRDVAAKADDEVELQFLGQHPVELVVAEAAIGHDAHPDIGGQDFGQAHQDLILVAVATVFQRRLVHGQPNQRRGPSVAGQQRQHDRRLTVGVELGPVHRHRDAVAFADHVRHPMPQQGIDVDALVGQQPVHLLDRVLGQPPACQRQTLADQADRQRRGLDRPERGSGQRLHPFGVQVVAKQRVEEVVDTVKGKRLTHRRHGMGPSAG